jgi:hypothetical protein
MVVEIKNRVSLSSSSRIRPLKLSIRSASAFPVRQSLTRARTQCDPNGLHPWANFSGHVLLRYRAMQWWRVSSSSTSILFRRRAAGFRLPKTLARVLACVAAMAACTLDARAANQFDGAWDFVLITKSGPCNPSYNVSGRIIDGAIWHGGVSGRVAPSGAVSATVSLGPIHAWGSGRFSGASGSGIWRGQGLGGPCSGTWSGKRK